MKKNQNYSLKPIQGSPSSIGINRTEASYQQLMLQMISSLIKQQRQNNTIMKSFLAQIPSTSFDGSVVKQNLQQSYTREFQRNHPLAHQIQKRSFQNSLPLKRKNLDQQHSKSVPRHQNTKLTQQALNDVEGYESGNKLQQEQSESLKLLQSLKENSDLQKQIIVELRSLTQSIKQSNINLTKKDQVMKNEAENHMEASIFNQQKYYSRISQIQPHTDERQLKVRIDFLKILYANLQTKGNIIKDLQTKDAKLIILVQHIKQNPQGKKIIYGISLSQFENYVIEWLGVTYRITASICWKILQKQNLTFDQVKVLFTENIIFNYIELMHDIRNITILNNEQAADKSQNKNLQLLATNVINKQSIEILKYLCTQYPQTQIQAPNMALRRAAPLLDEKGKNQFQILGKSGLRFRYKANGEYASQIMRFINYLIVVSQNKYEYFEKQMKTIFQKIFDKRQMVNNSNRQGFMARSSDFDEQELKQYRQKVKKYTKYAIGRKIGKNTPKYTQQQIQNGVFFLKSTKVLRVLVKWVQQLTEYIQNPKKTILNWHYPFKDHNGNQIHAQFPIRNGIYQVLMQKRNQIKGRLQEIAQSCFKIECLLTQQGQSQVQTLLHLSQEQANVGMFSSNVRKALSTYLYMQLNALIDFLLMVPRKVDEKRIGIEGRHFQRKARTDLDDINLVTFRVFDLLRCKCVSNQQEIMFLINQFKSRNQKHQLGQQKSQKPIKQFTLVRVKDRLDAGMRDVLINAQFLEGPVCEIQLCVASQLNIKQDLLGSYNHFLYELRRSTMLGPLVQNVSIWTTLEQRAGYFDQITDKRFKTSKNIAYKPVSGSQPSFNKYSGPIVCQSCKVFYHIPRSCLMNWINSKSKTVCGQCRYLGFSEAQKKKQIFGSTFSQKFLEKVYEVPSSSKPEQLPQLCFVTKKVFLRAELSFIRNNRPTEQFKKREIAQIVIRGDPYSSQENVKLPISTRGFLSQIHSDERYDFKHFIIFGIDRKHTTLKTIPEVREIIKKNPQVKVVDLLHQPNYTENLQAVQDQSKRQKLIASIQRTMEGKQFDKVIVIEQNNANQNLQTLILAQIYMSGQELKRKLIKRANIQKINDYANKNSSVMSLQHKMITNELDISRIDRFIGRKFWDNLCKNITHLFLNFGNIQNVQALGQMKLLQILSMNHNCLKSLKGLQTLTKLRKVQFDSNYVTSLLPLANLVNLQFIHANENKIISLDGIQNLTKVIELSLYKNQIETIGDCLMKLNNLEILYLRGNKIKQIKSAGNYKNLSSLSLSQNPIENIESIKFNFCLHLISLSISNMKIKRIPGQIFSSLKLVDLSLNGNEIQKIQNLESQTQLRILGLGQNSIQKMENLQHLKHIQKLYLPANKIKKIQNILPLLDTLELLDISKNPLEECGQLLMRYVKCRVLWTVSGVSPRAKQQILRLIFAPFYRK